MDMKHWMERVSGGATVNAVAKAAQISQATLDGQLKSTSGLKPDRVVQIARVYGADPVAALVELGLITAEEAGAEGGLTEAQHMAWLRDAEGGATDAILLAEIGRRLAERQDVEQPID